METDKDYIHLLIECSPQHQIPNIIKALKGVSARLLFLKHPEIKKISMGRKPMESKLFCSYCIREYRRTN